MVIFVIIIIVIIALIIYSNAIKDKNIPPSIPINSKPKIQFTNTAKPNPQAISTAQMDMTEYCADGNEPFINEPITHETTDFIVFDFETANYKRYSACAIGIAKVENLEIISSSYYLIKPADYGEFLPQFTKLHGIDMDMIEYEPFFDKVWDKIEDDFLFNHIIAYNLPFDRDVLTKTLNYYGNPVIGLKGSCALQLARNNIKGLTDYKLSTVCNHLEVELDHHNPESDARAAAMVVIHIVKDMIKVQEAKEEKERIKNEKLALKAKKAEVNSDDEKVKELETIKRNIRRNRKKMETFPDDESYKKLHEEYLVKHKEVAGYDYVSTK